MVLYLRVELETILEDLNAYLKELEDILEGLSVNTERSECLWLLT